METKLETFSKQKFCINPNVVHTLTSTCHVLTVKNMFFIVTLITPQSRLSGVFIRTTSRLITVFHNLK